MLENLRNSSLGIRDMHSVNVTFYSILLKSRQNIACAPVPLCKSASSAGDTRKIQR